MGAKCGRKFVVFCLFLQYKVVFCTNSVVGMNFCYDKYVYKDFVHIGFHYGQIVSIKFGKVSKLMFTGNVACTHYCIGRRRVYHG